MRKSTVTVLVAAATLASLGAGADESSTIFDQLQRLDATAVGEQRRASVVQAQMVALDGDLNRSWPAVDVAVRAARPIRREVTHSLARWMSAHRAAERETMGTPNARSDTRRLLNYAAQQALSSRLRDVDVVRRADAERAGFEGLMARRAQWGVEFARTSATAGASTGARAVLIDDARAGGAASDFAATNDDFEKVLGSLEPTGLDVDFHRVKGTLARPIPQPATHLFGTEAPLVRPGGWTYRAAVGADVHAIHAGEVVFVGAAQGWGLVVVVDHGGGYRSAYGHLDRTELERGAKVERAQVIGAVGESGSLDGARLYFELRKSNKPVDPAQWFLKR